MTSHRVVFALAAALTLAPAAARSTAASTTTAHPAKAAAHGAMVLPFIENDLDRAMKEATARKLPIFVEAWAPW